LRQQNLRDLLDLTSFTLLWLGKESKLSLLSLCAAPCRAAARRFSPASREIPQIYSNPFSLFGRYAQIHKKIWFKIKRAFLNADNAATANLEIKV